MEVFVVVAQEFTDGNGPADVLHVVAVKDPHGVTGTVVGEAGFAVDGFRIFFAVGIYSVTMRFLSRFFS
jgi:hypothetical protein